MHRLGGNRLGDGGTITICKALSESRVSKLQELGLEENDITEKGAKSVAAYLAVSTSLTNLS